MTGFNFKDVGEATRNSKESLKQKINDLMFGELQEVTKKKINKKVLISGENGTAKTSLALSLLTQNLEDDEIIIYIDGDNSGHEIIQSFYYDYFKKHQIRYYNPTQTKEESNGRIVKDEAATAGAIGTVADVCSDAIDNGIKVKGVIVDGLSFLLQYCEAIMRYNKNKAVDEGIPQGAWKIRNDEFKKIYSLYMALPTTVIFISHEDFAPEFQQEKPVSNVKKIFINECSMRILTESQSSDNPYVDNYVATIRKNRADVTQVNKVFNFMSVNQQTAKIDFNSQGIEEVIFPTEKVGQEDEQDIE